EDSRGLIWIGTFDGGLNRLDPVSGRISRIAYSENEPSGSDQIPASERVVSIIEDEDGFLWIGTYSGLRKYEPTTGRSWRFGSVDGLPSDAVLGVTDGHDGTLWISTSQAVSRFDIETSTFTNYTAESGLPLLQFNPGAISSTASGTILIGGNDGFITFDPEDLVSNRSVPQIVITEIRRGNDVIATDVWSGEELHLSYRDGIIGLKFALLDYANPSTHEFQYILEGFEQSWHDVQGPVGEATITNTTGRSGTFRFRVRGVGRSGMSNELILSVIIRAPWWRTPLFAIFITIIVVITATAIIVRRIRKRRYERVETQRMLSESRERERLRLTRELHDSPLQNLYSARHKLELIALVDGASENNDIIDETQKILQQTAEDLRRICGELRPPTLEDFGLEKTIRSHLREFGSEHPNLELEADLLPDELRLPEDIRLALFRIYQNAMNNVVRHAHANKVSIELFHDSEKVVLSIRDDGRGFTVPDSWLQFARDKHYGLLGISEWAESAGGYFKLKSRLGHGTLVQVTVPLRQDASRMEWSRIGKAVRDHFWSIFRIDIN
ncbi:MAG: hypothetical protein IIA50_07050, partial [Bacteroidetes bacterium]|nr:hypothetical protein [Bacteroidota bacterium]